MHLTQLRHPVNTKIDWVLTSDRIIGRNTLARRAVEEGAEWLLFLDDDHLFRPDILNRLLAWDVPIVGGLYLQRMMPFASVAYTAKTESGNYIPIDLTSLPGEGLAEVCALGTGGMLIRTEVFREIGGQWFEHGRASEDLIFCDKAVEAGFPIYVDLGVHLGHLSPSAIWPSFDEGKWNVGVSVADNFSMKVPIQPPEPVED